MVWELFFILLTIALTTSINVQRPSRINDAREYYDMRNFDTSYLGRITNSINNNYRTTTNRPFWGSTKKFYDAFKTIQRRSPLNITKPTAHVSFRNTSKSRKASVIRPTNNIASNLTNFQNITKNQILSSSKILENNTTTKKVAKFANTSLSSKLPILDQMALASDKMDQISLKTNINILPTPNKTLGMIQMENLVKKYIHNSKKNLNNSIQKIVQNLNTQKRITPKTSKIINQQPNLTLLKMTELTFRKNAINESKINFSKQDISNLSSSVTHKSPSPVYIIIHDLREDPNLNISLSHSDNSTVMNASHNFVSNVTNFDEKSNSTIKFIENIDTAKKTFIKLPTELPESDYDISTTEATKRGKIAIKIEDNVNRYIAGQPIKISDQNEFEMVVLLVGYRNREVVEKFTGTLVAPQWIITAASIAKEDMLIYARSPNCPKNTCYNENIHKIYYHPEYLEIEDDENDMKLFCNNIALLRLRNPWRYGIPFAVMPYKFFPTKFHQLFESCLSVNYDGYLFWEKHSEVNENHLTKMRVNILHPARYCTHMGFCENDECSSLYGYAYAMSSSIDNGICKRDVGSPLFCRSNNKWVLMGVRSSTNGCYLGFRYAASSYTRVDSLSLWINYTLGINHSYQYTFPYY